jgi:hypothetical protein
MRLSGGYFNRHSLCETVLPSVKLSKGLTARVTVYLRLFCTLNFAYSDLLYMGFCNKNLQNGERKEFYKCYTFNDICNDNYAINCITIQHKKAHSLQL